MKEKIETENLCVIKAFEKAWQTLDASIVEPYLVSDFHYDSQWVLSAIESKEEYMNYLTGKFNAIRKGNAPVKK